MPLSHKPIHPSSVLLLLLFRVDIFFHNVINSYLKNTNVFPRQHNISLVSENMKLELLVFKNEMRSHKNLNAHKEQAFCRFSCQGFKDEVAICNFPIS